MAKPIINKIDAFNAKMPYTISFSYSGALPYANKVTIYNALSMLPVWSDTQTGIGLNHTIPANTLVNGAKYAITVAVADKFGTYSTTSDKAYFFCRLTPEFYFSGLDGSIRNTINSASYYAQLVYKQVDFEDIAQFQFFIYDEGKDLLSSSDVFHNVKYLTYEFKALENDKVYYIRATGLTEHGIKMDTGYIEIYITYRSHTDYALLYADCNDYTSIVTYHTNFVVIYPSEEDDYEYDDSIIDLSHKKLVYDQGYVINGDFTMTIRGINLWREGVICECNNSDYGFTLSSYIYDDGTLRYKLTVNNAISSYIIYSEPLVFSQNQMVTIHIRRIKDVYQLVTFITDYTNKKNYWFGADRPMDPTELHRNDIWINTDNTPTVLSKQVAVQVDYTNSYPTIAGDYENIWLADF